MKFNVFRNFDKEKGEIYFTFDSQKFFSEIELDRIHFAPILKNEKLKLFVNFFKAENWKNELMSLIVEDLNKKFKKLNFDFIIYSNGFAFKIDIVELYNSNLELIIDIKEIQNTIENLLIKTYQEIIENKKIIENEVYSKIKIKGVENENFKNQ